MSTTTDPAATGHRIYFIDGPAQGRSTFLARTPWTLTWHHEGCTHSYQRLAHVRGTQYYRHVR